MTINFHTEALVFCKQNNLCPLENLVAIVEKAMTVGAALMVEDVYNRVIKPVDDKMTKLREDSKPHTNIIRTVAL